MNARQLYVDAEPLQTDAQRLATETRDARDELLKAVTDERITFQFAANAEWPHTEKKNRAKRRAFALPPEAAFNG